MQALARGNCGEHSARRVKTDAIQRAGMLSLDPLQDAHALDSFAQIEHVDALVHRHRDQGIAGRTVRNIHHSTSVVSVHLFANFHRM